MSGRNGSLAYPRLVSVRGDRRREAATSGGRINDVPGLYIVDGSVVPTSIAVNPQLTIMALATRAGEIIGKRLG